MLFERLKENEYLIIILSASDSVHNPCFFLGIMILTL